MDNKMKSCVVAANEGDAFWQPGVKGNCITIKVSPWNVDKTQHTVFLHELPKGGEVPEHSHEANEEIFICVDGEGTITVDGKEITFKKHDVAFLAPLSKHRIQAISDEPLKFMVVISPTGLEDRLKLMGIAKTSRDETAPDAFDSVIGKGKSHGVV
jgi:quercetin dioxygenase-like cupin family protein